ncbi:MAG: phage Gp37/Gp68 family protein [Spirochaetes bacterium]|nr:phage Gp37/Gp68 family protein [Spirochaetota bacterium]
MSYNSSIEWTDATWNPLTGCNKISEGCRYCYAEKLSIRLQAMKSKKYQKGFELCMHDEVLNDPLCWKKPKNIFVNSMSDTFHENVPDSFILRMFDVMNRSIHHKFQVLTKRSSRLLMLNKLINWTDNIWLGVTVENNETKYRIDDLKATSAKIKFISFEPLLSNINDINLNGINWIIVGGESGPGAREMEEKWVDNIYSASKLSSSSFFFKQWGGVNRKIKGRIYHGREYNEYPSIK